MRRIIAREAGSAADRGDEAGAHKYAAILDDSYGALKGVSARNLVIGGGTFTTGDISALNWLKNLRLSDGKAPRSTATTKAPRSTATTRSPPGCRASATRGSDTAAPTSPIYATRLHPRLKARALSLKRVLKAAVADLFPPEIMGRAKHGFGVPLDRWFREDLRPYLASTLRAPRCPRQAVSRARSAGARPRGAGLWRPKPRSRHLHTAHAGDLPQARGVVTRSSANSELPDLLFLALTQSDPQVLTREFDHRRIPPATT
jgi:hypothetical protein